MTVGDTTDVLVLRKNAFGSTREPLANALEERLPDRRVRRATTPQQEAELLPEAKVLVGGSVNEDTLRHAKRLQLVAYTRVGVADLPTDALQERGIAATNASGVRSPAIAEDVLGHILTFSRRLREAWDRKRRREWRHFSRSDLAGSTVTVVGLGSIGMEVVRRLAGFDVNTIGLRFTPSKGGPTDEVAGFDRESIHDALARTDYLVLATPLTDETRGLIGSEELTTLPPRSVLINVGRGKVVDTEALVSAIRTESIRGAALDVTDPQPLPEDHPLWMFDNVCITPHIAGSTERGSDRLADIIARNVRILDGDVDARNLENEVVPIP